jgi:hypothetical protein
VLSASSGIDVVDCYEVYLLRKLSIGIVPNQVRNRLGFSMALVPHLQL